MGKEGEVRWIECKKPPKVGEMVRLYQNGYGNGTMGIIEGLCVRVVNTPEYPPFQVRVRVQNIPNSKWRWDRLSKERDWYWDENARTLKQREGEESGKGPDDPQAEAFAQMLRANDVFAAIPQVRPARQARPVQRVARADNPFELAPLFDNPIDEEEG